MKHFYLFIGFVVGACATRGITQITEYTLDPLTHVLRVESDHRALDIRVGEAEGFKCFKQSELQSMKNYIVTIEEQLKDCQRKLP